MALVIASLIFPLFIHPANVPVQVPQYTDGHSYTCTLTVDQTGNAWLNSCEAS
jgi:hypothetical protein